MLMMAKNKVVCRKNLRRGVAVACPEPGFPLSFKSSDQVDLLLMAHPGEPMEDLAKKLGAMGVSVGRMIKNGGMLGVSAPLEMMDELQAMPEIDQIKLSGSIALPPMIDNIPQ
jgi:hypothetical protein